MNSLKRVVLLILLTVLAMVWVNSLDAQEFGLTYRVVPVTPQVEGAFQVTWTSPASESYLVRCRPGHCNQVELGIVYEYDRTFDVLDIHEVNRTNDPGNPISSARVTRVIVPNPIPDTYRQILPEIAKL